MTIPFDRLHPVLAELWMPDSPDITWQLRGWQGVEGLSSPYAYDLELFSENSYESCEGALGANCELLLDRNGLVCVCYGVFEHIEIQTSVETGVESPGILMRARMVPAFKLLDQRSDTRFFAGKTVIEILEEVLEPALADYGREVDVESHIKGHYNARDYCVQFRESTFAFCNRLMEEEGIAYFFVPNDDDQVERLVLIDNNEDYQDAELLVPGPLPIVLNRAENLDRESLQAFDWRHSKTPNRVLTRGYNRKVPSEFDEGEAQREDPQHPSERARFLDDVTRQIVDDPVNDPRAQSFTGIDLDQRGALAERVHQRHALEARLGFGRSNAIGFCAGGLFTLDDHPLESLAAHEFLLTQVRHSSPGEGEGYSNEFECIPREQVFRPARTTARPLVHGIQTGVVVGPALDEIYTDPSGRIRVKFHRDRHSGDDHEASCWIPVAQIWAGNGFGAQVIPRVGMEVVVAFVDGNPDRPIVTGCVYNGDNRPPYELPTDSTKSTFKSQSSPGGEGFNELRFEDAHGSEQLFIHAQRRMDMRVRGSLYETSGGSREERIGWEHGDDHGGDHNTSVMKDVNHHVHEIRYTKIEKQQYETVIEDVIEDYQAKHIVLVGDTSQLSAPKVIVEASDHVSHKAGEIKLSGSSAVHLKGGGKVAIESNNAIELKVGGSFISITPGEIAIQGVTVRINSGGGVGSAGDADAAEAVEMLDPLDALAADSGRPGSGHGGGGGRTRSGRTLEPHRAPPMEPPPPPAPGQPSVLPDGTLRQFLTIEWGEVETWCSEPATLRGTTQGYTDGDTESAEVRNTSDGAVQRAVTLRINSDAFTHNFDVVDLLPRRAGANFESERTLDAVAVGQTTPTAIRLRFIPNLTQTRCSTGRARFNLTVANYMADIGGTINYVPGWMRFCIQLDSTVPVGTGGDIGLLFATNAAHEYSGGGWRYAMRSPTGTMRYWDGSAWTNVPATWTQNVGVRNRLLDMAVWTEGGTNKTQYGTLAWPGTVPAWGPTETALAATVLPQWTTQINTTWTNKFDLKRQECRSTDPQCCRYKTRCTVTFNQTATKGTGIVLAANSGRSEANVWSLTDTSAMPSHEFGHHLGNPDEYAGAAIDTSLNTDGATAGIDPNSIMGQNMTTVKRRHYTTICQHLASMVSAQVSRTYTYSAVPVV